MTQEYLKPLETMKFLGIKSYKTLNAFIKAGLPYVVINGTKYISKTSLIDFMKSHEVSHVG